jgi:arabinan endo-1,5-alpha-L-arabinosidase
MRTTIRKVAFRSLVLYLSLAGAQSPAWSQKTQPEVLKLEGDISPIHDPAIIREGDTFYVFSTNRFAGQLLPIFCSQDLHHWKFCGHVFDSVPEWALREIPGARGIWAPDISYFNGKYCLYYSVSTFGSNHSAIGLITNQTLDPGSHSYRWVDEGLVVSSRREDDWNAIDPNIVAEANGDIWLALGSFWGGIKLRKLDPKTGKLSRSDTTLYSLASRRPLEPPAIEAPSIVRHEKYYYLFVSFDFCCRGKDSSYKIMVGRSKKITGPYFDRDGKPLMAGGGTLLMAGNGAWRGPGGQSVLLDTGSDLLVFHSYNSTTGKAALQISTIVWEDGWPRAGVLP